MTDRIAPRVENAPGLIWKPRKGGWEARWQARTDLIQRGFLPKTARIWAGAEPSDAERDFIAMRCQQLQAKMLVWGHGGLPVVQNFDGTLRGLIASYQTDKDSTYRTIRYNTRKNYDNICLRLAREFGDIELSEIKARTVIRWHEGWSSEGRVFMGHGMVGMLRTLFSFGATILESADCERLCGVMHRMRFKMGKPRKERITAAQVDAIRAKAHAAGYHSIALAQAFQFELMLRQKDVIGEWAPLSEPGTTELIQGNLKWLRGIRWSEIDGDLILRHTTSKRGKDIEVDLKLAPMVLEELARFPTVPASGPIVVCEETGAPWLAAAFRRRWRRIATAAGLPAEVYNMDSRAGAISEATDAGAELEHIRHAATHSDIGMTQRYSRGSFEKVSNVMTMRAAHRNKTGTVEQKRNAKAHD